MTRKDKAAIVARLDNLEAELCGAYKVIERIRLDLQRDWCVVPSDYKDVASGSTK